MQHTDLRNQLWDMSKTLLTDLTATLEPIIRRCGLTMIQLRFLCEIKARAPVTVGMLNRFVGENKGNCSNMCKKLEQAGYVTRTRRADDERRVELRLTGAGERLLLQIARETELRYASLFEEIPQEELDAILCGMKRLTDALHRISVASEETCEAKAPPGARLSQAEAAATAYSRAAQTK